ncbi:MAG: adenylate kinase [Planctomycetota bacterium]
MNLILIGPPGSGKGTQSDYLVQTFGAVHVSTGDMLRKHVKDGTAIGKKAKSFMDSGALVPDDLIIEMMADRLNELEAQKKPWLLDGYPRSLKQANALKALASSGNKVDAVIYLDVSDNEVVRRLCGRRTCPVCKRTYHVEFMKPKVEGKCDADGADLIIRDDDKEATIRNRLATYHSQTADVVSFYRKEGVLKEIAGESAPADVTIRVADALGKGVK